MRSDTFKLSCGVVFRMICEMSASSWNSFPAFDLAEQLRASKVFLAIIIVMTPFSAPSSIAVPADIPLSVYIVSAGLYTIDIAAVVGAFSHFRALPEINRTRQE